MATALKNPTENAPTLETMHIYHAEASALSGSLQLPLSFDIRPQAFVNLDNQRGGYVSQRAEKYRLEGVISFESAYTQVSGNRSRKAGRGWVTLATSVVEGLNILDIITADRVVAQVSTEHAVENGHVPQVTFLGSRFENLRVSGYDSTPQLNLGACGTKPNDDALYTEDPGFLTHLEQECQDMQNLPGLPDSLKEHYDRELKTIARFKNGNAFQPVNRDEDGPSIQCSLIQSVPKTPVSTPFGNTLEVPGFGLVSLAQIEIGTHFYADKTSRPTNYFRLTMLDMHLGCVGEGNLQGVTAATNGKTKP